MFDPHWRRRSLDALAEPFDVIVVGGGITGCGVFFDAAQRGLRTLLVEQGDVASGTSSRSSKLVHGGLRYLKQMHFRITAIAARERDRMTVLNPGLVESLRFVYPANRGDRMPSWQVDLGLWMYDRLTRKAQHHRHLEVADVERLLPGMATDDLERAFSYGDARTDDARLTLAVAATGYAYGGFLLTRARVAELTASAAGRIDGVVLEDLEGGGSHAVKAHVVVNAAGVWVDDLRTASGLGEPRVRPSRGVHLVLPASRLPVAAAAMVPSPDDGRPIFLIPHPEGVLVGTTDIYHDGPRGDPRATRAEVDYLLRAMATHFPDHGLGFADVVGVFAGLRPILDSHTDNPSDASREEDIWQERGLVSVAGGKLTTWRPTAEEAVDEVVRYLPDERADAAAPCYTKGTPLAGYAPLDLPEQLTAVHGLAEPVARAMARRLRRSASWAPRLARDREELAPVAEGTDLCAAEVRCHLAFGAVLRLEDLLLRRVRLGMWEPETATAVAPRLRPLFAQELGWDGKRWEAELESFHAAAEAWTPAGIVG
ncbi:MAG: glycerol-3-phosphate dehydrogenase/oxidase [Acidobacteriota bacterium]|nr:glycerol-3-phosphate dehydrogenase/oxidase [Acidobacteriota bacterium]